MNEAAPTLELFDDREYVYKKFLPKINHIKTDFPPINEWDIPSTIKDLSYLTHSDYRYYGKFPSVVAGQLLEQYKPPTSKHYVLDNFCGSGTTLVEAKLRGIDSYGLDISWLSMIASNVKANVISTSEVRTCLSDLISWFENNKELYTAPDDNFVQKWFSNEAARDLKVIQTFIFNLPSSDVKDFLLVAYIGIVRRVSKAYDGEVRPHINKDKKQREVISAFSKKVSDMCVDHDLFNQSVNKETKAEAVLGDNLNLPERFNDKHCHLVISHPPYLNSFNYAPVFSLEFYWGDVFEEQYSQGNKKVYKQEMKAHPANESITEKYFNHLKKCYEETYKIQEKGAYLAVVIGDCTRKGELIPVVDKTIEIVESIGYSLHELNYRTTHYGLGKYAYKHRADYHGAHEEKRDGIIVFKK
ncbi:hypothetical protein DU002_12500 [Corallincola holothuriorum]|uniref:DNA methylase N-4/N-6 domain-containing protein n=1 Tax=Corallincola holothuriorum TaxID=2282215 RepID=A0A368NIB8_9GAMM|nr:DNA methyltransferase [Corallincola holothuriorum]RCU49169.1 hypothetical protein DU002_12500 [Corallincola holothuriorum]